LSKKSSLRFSLCILLGIIFLLLFSLNSEFIVAGEITEYPDVRVNRVIHIENSGTLVMNDTVTLSSSVNQNVQSLDNFQIGFPSEYKNNLAYFFAYDSSGRLGSTLDNSVDETGFSWIKISFSKTVDVSGGNSYVFNVIYVFSGLATMNLTVFHVDFSTYPTLKVEAAFCNVTIMLPVRADLIAVSPFFSNRTLDSRRILYTEQSPLGAYANVSSWVEFTRYGFQLFDVEEWRREIKIDGLGGFVVTDFYQITKRSDEKMDTLSFVLPSNATDVSVQDVYGTYTQTRITVKDYEKYVEVKVYLRDALKTSKKIKLLIVYKLPFWEYVIQRGWQDYTLNFSLTRPDNWVVKRFTATVSLPEGAVFRNSSKTPYHLEKENFLVKVKFTGYNITRFHEQNIRLEYQYLILWASFRPTLWMGTFVAILGGIFFIRKAFKPTTIIAVHISSEVLRKFVDTYEEKRRIEQELESLAQQVRKGKISRRRYRLRKSSLDGRLLGLEKSLSRLKKEIAAAGRDYSERMKQLETAEAEIETLNRDIERVETRFRRRELSAEARRKLLDEYNRIKEQAENTIAEILLRLREEIH